MDMELYGTLRIATSCW